MTLPLNARDRVKEKIVQRLIAKRQLTMKDLVAHFAVLSPVEKNRFLSAINSNSVNKAGRAILALKNQKLREMAELSAEDLISGDVVSIDDLDKVI